MFSSRRPRRMLSCREWRQCSLSLLRSCLTAALLLLVSYNSYSLADDRPPNIVLIMADDIGVEGIGCYGCTSYQTPNIDQLAATGLRFKHAHAQPLCTNTRLQLMTGLHNNRNWLYFGILPPDSRTIGHYMQDAGYRTCIAGKWQLQSYDPPDYPGSKKRRGTGMHPKDAGFHRYALFHSLHTEDKGSRYADPKWLEDGELKEVEGSYGPDEWVNYINDFMAKEKDRPFFVYYPMALPHWPMTMTPDSEQWNSKPEDRLNADPVNFRDMVQYMDKCVGRIVKKIDDLGLRDNTLIIFYSDNGTHLKITTETVNGPVRGGKGTPLNAGTHVPLIANWPGHVRVGDTDALVDSTDFIPTITEAADKPLPEDHGLDGISFFKHLFDAGSTSPQRESIYCFYDPRPGWDKDQFSRHDSARDQRWKLYETGNLFDIENDVLEQRPIAAADDSEKTEKIRNRLQKVLDRNAVETH